MVSPFFTPFIMRMSLFLVVLFFASFLSAQDIALPEPVKEGGMPLMQALNERHSSHEYTDQELSRQQLSDLLWAAFGYNRGEQLKRTAPSLLNMQEIEMYVVMKSGYYLYDAKDNILVQKGLEDVSAEMGVQDFVKVAAVNLVYVANCSDDEEINERNNLLAACTNVGFISQNVYLYSMSAGLSTVVRGWFREDAVKAALQLPVGTTVILTQTVGYGE